MSNNKLQAKKDTQVGNKITIKSLVHNEEFIKKAQDVLGTKTQQFMTSVLSLVNSDKLLSECDAIELYNTCLMAAALDLPTDKNLGFAYVLAYKNHKTGKVTPQLQIGYKGFIQLAQRTGQFELIHATDVREGELVGINRLTGENQWNWVEDEEEREKLPVIGYVGYFKLKTGFSKEVYWPVEKLIAHAKKYSQSFAKSGSGVWKDEFDAMAKKTVIKLLLKTYAPLSVGIQTAIEQDQADANGNYIDRKQEIEVSSAEIGDSEEAIAEAEVVEETEEVKEKEVEEETNPENQSSLNLDIMEEVLGGPVEVIKVKK